MTTTLITGANRGIGLELARQLQARGERVIATRRSPAPALDALGVQQESLEITDSSSVNALAHSLGDTPIDTLILNAGVLRRSGLDDLDLPAMRLQFEVNALGPLRVVAALRSLLQSGSKIAIITSRMGSIEDNTSGGAYGYRMSKAAVNAAGKSLALDLRGQGVSVVLLHPGYVRTDMTGGRGNWDADEAAAALIARIDELSPEQSGRFLHANGEPLPW
ncbi:MAG: SDR family oxidoreductase [Deltaproteobacteria bacterium]|nr:MAG: SDR family oxidoreductase [Deltaproteobacteria bacterium]